MVEDIFRIIIGVAGEYRIGRIDSVNIAVGEYMQVNPSLLEFAFEAASEGTIASGAKLNVEYIPLELKCRKCNNLFRLDDMKYECPVCGCHTLDIVSGKDLYIKSIGGE